MANMENRYYPEGALIGTAENTAATASLFALERAWAQGKILEANAVMCDSADMCLRVNLGFTEGIIPREEAVFSPDGTDTKDIAIITRVGKPVCFKVRSITMDGGEPRVILSRKDAQAECMANYISHLKAGDIIPVRVTHMEPFGAFVDIGCGIVSLLTVDAISVSRISHPRDRLSVGQRMMAVVRSVDGDSGRIYMTHRELLGTWQENADNFKPCQTVTGIVRSIEEYGIFVELAPNLAGLAELREDVSVGDACSVYIKSIVPEKMKIKLVIIDTYSDPVPMPERYYIDTDTVRHMDRWLYSPESCPKLIESVFE